MDRGDPMRVARLATIFNDVCAGTTQITTKNASLFLESICDNADAVSCMGHLLSSQNGLAALQLCLQLDASSAFLNTGPTAVFVYLANAESKLSMVQGGASLGALITKIISPPTFWQAIVDVFRNRLLSADGEGAFAWILEQIVSSRHIDIPEYDRLSSQSLAQDFDVQERLTKSASSQARKSCIKIKQLFSEPVSGGDSGGRHDNDHPDFRQISILPTADELACSTPPIPPSRRIPR